MPYRDTLRQALQHTISALRMAKGLSQQELALRSGLTRHYISLLERQKREPKLGTLLQLAEGLGVSLAEFSLEFEKLHEHYRKHRPPIAQKAAESMPVTWKATKKNNRNQAQTEKPEGSP